MIATPWGRGPINQRKGVTQQPRREAYDVLSEMLRLLFNFPSSREGRLQTGKPCADVFITAEVEE